LELASKKAITVKDLKESRKYDNFGFMENEDLLKRITMNPDICFGKPTIRNMRYPVELILDLLSGGMTNEEILADYPDLEEKDIFAALDFAARLMRVNSVSRVLAA